MQSRQRKSMGIKKAARGILMLVGLSGCASIGPATVARDRFDYITAISDSRKSQMLLNLVKLRYGNAPEFLDVTSVINQYTVEASGGFLGSWFQNPFSSAQSLNAQGSYSDRPTITYSPVSGEKFARGLVTPIPPLFILNLIQAGYPVDLVLRLCVHAINGIYSRYAGPLRSREADPEFYPLVEKLRKIQQAGEIGMHLKKADDREATIILFKRRVNPALEADAAEVRKILGLDPEAQEFNVVYGTVSTNNREIALLTRPMIEILIDLSSYIEVPAASLAEGRTFPSPPPELVNGDPVIPLIRILSSPQRPEDFFASVPYRQDWYWIDDKDFLSKRLFSFVMFLFTFLETDTKQGGPVITLPAG
jgi:hypothetical protein